MNDFAWHYVWELELECSYSILFPKGHFLQEKITFLTGFQVKILEYGLVYN